MQSIKNTPVLFRKLTNEGTGIIPAGENGIGSFSNPNSYQYGQLSDFITDQFDDLNLDVPQGYLVYVLFDQNLRVLEENSGVRRVETADVLGQLAVMEQVMPEQGYFYTYVTNQSAKSVTFDNLTITHKQGKLKTEYNYYPYGLMWKNPAVLKYDYTYQGKEWQMREWSTLQKSLDLYDFGARMYDPVLGRWHSPDPAEQFAGLYIGMGNNPAKFADPDGRNALAATGFGALFGAVGYALSTAISGDSWNWGAFGAATVSGAISGAASYGIGSLFGSTGTFANEAYRALGHGLANAGIASAMGGNPTTGSFLTAAASSGLSSSMSATHFGIGAQITTSTIFGGAITTMYGGDFIQGATVSASVAVLNHAMHNLQGDPTKKNNPYGTPEGQPSFSLEEFYENYKGMSYWDIITESGFADGLPGGPLMRFVRNPSSGKVMDMRHVMVVGFGGGTILSPLYSTISPVASEWLAGNSAGVSVEEYQFFSGNENSAFARMDLYSNNIGSSFATYYKWTFGALRDWTTVFYNYIK